MSWPIVCTDCAGAVTFAVGVPLPHCASDAIASTITTTASAGKTTASPMPIASIRRTKSSSGLRQPQYRLVDGQLGGDREQDQ